MRTHLSNKRDHTYTSDAGAVALKRCASDDKIGPTCSEKNALCDSKHNLYKFLICVFAQ